MIFWMAFSVADLILCLVRSTSYKGKSQTRINPEKLMFLQSDGDEGIQPSAGMYQAVPACNVLCGIV